MLNSKLLLKISCAAALLSSCATTIPDIEVCVPTDAFPGVAALCQHTNSDRHRRLTPPELVDMIYARPAIPDPRNPGKMLPEKGPAMIVSSEDYAKNDAALAKLCVKAPCSYEVKKEFEDAQMRMKNLIKEAKDGKK